jgi:hypothetical protein
MSCTTLTIECFKAAYTANVGYDSLFCGLKVTCDSNVKYIRAPYVADFNGNTLMLHGWDKSETVIDDVTVTGLSVAQVKDLVATCCCGDDQHLIVNNTPVGYIPTTSGNTSNLNEVVIDSGGDTWIIDINGDARKFNKGTVTSVGLSASGALSVTGSPVTGSGVMTLNWTGTTSQYVRGDGSLNTFPTIPVVQWSDSLVAYGRTSVGGLTYSTGLKYDYTNSAFSVGTRAAGSVGTGSVQLGGNSVISGGYAIGLGYQNTVSGNYSTASGYNHTVLANYCFVSGNANTQTNSSGVGSFLSGREISHGTGAYLFASGYLLTVSGHYSFTVGTENTNSGTYSAIIGRNGTVTHSGNVMLLDSGSGTNITSGTSNQFTARFYNGYRFMTTNTVRAMDISSSRVITIDNLAGSGTRMVVANSSGELSTQTIPSGTVTSVGASVTASTALTVSGSPITTSGVLAFSWTGTTSQYVRGNGTLDTFPTIPVVNDNTITLSAGTGLIGGGAFTLNQASNDTITFTLNAGLNDLTDVVLSSPSNGQIIQYNGTNWVNVTPTWTSNTGTVTSVALALPSDTFTISGSPVTTSGTLTGTYKSQTKKFVLAAPWGVDGTPFWRQLHPSDLQQSGATTGQVITWNGTEWAAANPPGGVTSVAAGNGMNFTTITATGSVVLGTPSSITLSSTNSVTSTSHTHAFVPGGTSSQYIRGDGVLQTFPTIPSVAGKYVALSDADAGYSGQLSAVNLNNYTKTQVIYSNGNVTNNPNANSYVVWIGSASNTYGAQMAINPSVSDKFFFRNNYNTSWSSWYQVASREWVISQNYLTSGSGNAVWYIQGTATDATTNSQDIVRTGRVRIGASGSSSYMLSVVGNAYIMNGVEINNNQSYKGFNTSATAVNLIKINSSNYIEVGQSTYDIYLPNYTSSRSADTVSTSDKYLYVNSSGYLKADSAKWVRNYGASVFTTADESHIADSTPRRVTFDSYVCNNDYGYFSYSFSSGDYKVAGATGQMFMVICTLEYTTSGTPTVTAQLRVGGATKETNISTSADGRKVMTIHTVTAGGGSGNFEVYLSVSGSAIELKKCRLSVMPLGAECP